MSSFFQQPGNQRKKTQRPLPGGPQQSATQQAPYQRAQTAPPAPRLPPPPGGSPPQYGSAGDRDGAQVQPAAHPYRARPAPQGNLGAGSGGMKTKPQGASPQAFNQTAGGYQMPTGNPAHGEQDPDAAFVPSTTLPPPPSGKQPPLNPKTPDETAPGWDEVRDQWTDILDTHDKGLDDVMQGISADESRNARRSAEMNANMGGAVGGNFQSGQIQAQLGGSLLRSQARQEHTSRGLELKMTYLQRMMEEAMREGDRDLQWQIQQEMSKTQMAIAGMQQDTALAINQTQLEQQGDMRELDTRGGIARSGSEGGTGVASGYQSVAAGDTGYYADGTVVDSEEKQASNHGHLLSNDSGKTRPGTNGTAVPENWNGATREELETIAREAGLTDQDMEGRGFDGLMEWLKGHGLKSEDVWEVERYHLWYYTQYGKWPTANEVWDILGTPHNNDAENAAAVALTGGLSSAAWGV